MASDTSGESRQSIEDQADELFGRVEELEGYLRRMADALQEDGYEDDTVLVEVLATILTEAGFHA